MNIFRQKVCLLFIVLFFGLFTTCKENNIKESFPNIIIVFADDMGYGDVSALNPHARTYTPAIDVLIDDGLVFTEAHASASVCTPSRYGLLTGRYAFRNRVHGGNVNGYSSSVFESDRKTIAHLLHNAGYTTACVGKWHLGFDWETDIEGVIPMQDKATKYSNVNHSRAVKYGPNYYGFDYSFILPASLDMPPYLFLENQQAVDDSIILTSDIYPLRLEDTEYDFDKKHTGENDIYWHKGVWWRDGEMSASFRLENCLGNIVDKGIQFIEDQTSQNENNPFFLYLALSGPHTPWMPEDPFKGKSAIETYGDFILTIDNVVHRINHRIEELGIEKNTMLIFASDNGAYWPEQEIIEQQHDANWGRRGQKADIWDGGHHIPLVIKWPSKIAKSSVYNHLISLTDLYATFIDLTKQVPDINGGEDSFSFMDVLNGDLDITTRKSMIHQSAFGMYAIRADEWKYIDGLGSGGFTEPVRIKHEPGLPDGQLYNMNSDARESNNLFFEFPEKVVELKKELHKQIDQGYSREFPIR